MLHPGDPAPDFTAEDHLGNTHSLREYEGRTVVLWFYPKADTPGCTAEGCAFRDLHGTYEANDAVILGVSFDSPDENAAFASRYGFQYPLLSDQDRELALAYGACDDPGATLARRIATVIAPDGTVQEYHNTVNARTFPAELAARLFTTAPAAS
jgi:peroxiredoxin Q/BCP